MSDTPRTDAYIKQFPGCLREPKLLDFCRRLEKQLAEARAEIERLRARNAILDNAIAEVTEEQAALCAEGLGGHSSREGGSMSETPRTDIFCRTVEHTAVVGGTVYRATIETVDASFARQLEVELTDKDRLIKKMQKAFKEILKVKRTVDLNLFDVEQIHAIASAALAAERGE